MPRTRYKAKWKKPITIIGGTLFAVMLIGLFMKTMIYVREGNPFGHFNHYHQPVGTGLLLVLFFIGGPLAGVAGYRHLIKKEKSK